MGPDGSLYIADRGNHRIRRVRPMASSPPSRATGWGFSGDGGPALAARITFPDGVAVGSDGNLFIADLNNHRIRRVGPDGIITTVAGTGHGRLRRRRRAGDGVRTWLLLTALR